jgi:hypothetical protein
MRIAVLLATAAIVAYSSNLLLHIEGDASPNVLSAASWVAQGNADLDEYAARAPFTRQTIDGHIYPVTPPGTALLMVVPVWLAMTQGADPGTYEFLATLGKIAGVLAAGISVAFVYLACAALGRPIPALVAAVAYAFGTTVWSVSAQQIWMHGPAQLFVAIGLYLLAKPRGTPLAGFAMGLATIIRPVDALVAGIGVLAARRRGFAARYIAWGLPAGAFLLTYYVLAYRGLRESYGEDLQLVFPPPGLLGLLVSPSRGLFVYSPFVVFALVGFVMAWRASADQRALLVREMSLATLGTYAVYATFGSWWGGWAFGSRYMSDAQPLLALGLAYGIDRGLLAHALSRMAFAAALAWSVLVNFAGAGWYYFFWNGYHWDVTPNIDHTAHRVWDWADPQWGFVLRRMVFDPGFTLVPVLIGAAIAAFVVWRALAAARRLPLSPAEHEEVVHA